MNQHEKIEDYEYDFIKESFFENWPIRAIAEKLERPMVTIQAIIKRLSLHRANHNMRPPRMDWPSIWYAYQSLGSYSEASRATGFSPQAVRYAVSEMILMGSYKRLLKWNAYARLNDRENYTDDELNIGDAVIRVSKEEKVDAKILKKLTASNKLVKTRMKRGWSKSKAINTAVMSKSERARAGGEAISKGVAAAARANGMPVRLVYCRVNRGWSLERAVSTPIRYRSPNKSGSM